MFATSHNSSNWQQPMRTVDSSFYCCERSDIYRLPRPFGRVEKKPFLTKEQILFGIEKYKKLDLTTQEGKQRLIDGFINAIYVYDDRITFTYNYKDGTETITLSELESAKSSDIKCVGAPQKQHRLLSVLFLFGASSGSSSRLHRSCKLFGFGEPCPAGAKLLGARPCARQRRVQSAANLFRPLEFSFDCGILSLRHIGIS